jgi:ferredoxin/DNA-binding transcriptional ArsR family regulator
LDAIPNGFPATESGVELRLLAKLFTPEEAALASVMRLTREPAADIAARAGMDPDIARHTLKEMARKGLVRTKREDRQLTFGLMPFVVGIYEAQLPRMDAELAGLFEAYFQETRGGGIASTRPAIHRVIPVEEAIPFDLGIFPYERASEMLETAKSWGVRDCICRVQRRLIGKGCDHPVENCLIFAPVAGAFDGDPTTRAITKEEALRILRETEEAGLVHSTGNYRDGHSYICNCCTCCCGVLRGMVEFSAHGELSHSGFHATVDAGACIGCGACVERCQFGALAIPDDVCVVNSLRCVGCGLCATACASSALYLERREEREPLPTNLKEWMLRRAQERGIRMEGIV